MFNKQKMWRLLKQILFGLMCLAIIFAGVTSATISCIADSNETSTTTCSSISIIIYNNTNTETEVSPSHNGVSTMQLMGTGKEIARGDRAERLTRIAIRRAKRRALRRKRRIARIRRQKAWLAQHNTPENVEILSHLIEGEAGDQDDACQQSVGQVVSNRVKSKHFPNTIREVVFAPGQYACTWDGNYDRTPSEQAIRNAKAVLSGNVCIQVPENVVYQAQFIQGSGVWRKIGTETFCFE